MAMNFRERETDILIEGLYCSSEGGEEAFTQILWLSHCATLLIGFKIGTTGRPCKGGVSLT
jgi:hypothetical protein